jgi:hypothetical protein
LRETFSKSEHIPSHSLIVENVSLKGQGENVSRGENDPTTEQMDRKRDFQEK